jgi:hypothetical protein
VDLDGLVVDDTHIRPAVLRDWLRENLTDEDRRRLAEADPEA